MWRVESRGFEKLNWNASNLAECELKRNKYYGAECLGWCTPFETLRWFALKTV